MFTLKSQTLKTGHRPQLNQVNHIYYRQMDVLRLVFSQQIVRGTFSMPI